MRLVLSFIQGNDRICVTFRCCRVLHQSTIRANTVSVLSSYLFNPTFTSATAKKVRPSEITTALRAQLESLSPLVTRATRDRDDDNWVRQGIRPENEAESWEDSLSDKLDRAKTSTERDP